MTRRILTAAILIPIVLASIFYLPRPAFLVLMDLILLLTLWEFLNLVSKNGATAYWLTAPMVLGLPWVWAYAERWVLGYFIATILLLLVSCVFQTRDMKTGFASVAGNVLALIYLGVPLSIAGLLQKDYAKELLLILVTIWMTDAAAYFAGRLWGRHKITPKISPGKSLEGYLAGFLAAALTVPLYAHFLLPSWRISAAIITGVVLGVFGTMGDLFESVLKRGAGIKDSSNLIPGHGGMLDRIDSLLFAFPSYYLLRMSLLAS